MKLSIIIPHFNDHGRLAEAVSNVQTRCAPDTEVVIVDDHSSKAGVFPTGKNIRIHRNERNVGPSESRNMGVTLATGDYVMFLDSDDLLLSAPSRILARVEKMHGAPDIILCNMEDGRLPKPLLAHQNCLRRFEDDIFFSKVVHFTPHLYRKDFLVETAKPFPTDLRLGEDLVFIINSLARSKNLITLDETTYQYRRRSGSLSSRHYDLEDHYTLLERIPELFRLALADFPDHRQVRLSIMFVYRVRNAVRALDSFTNADPLRILTALRMLSSLGLAKSSHLREAAQVYWPVSLDHLLDLLEEADDDTVLNYLKENKKTFLP